MQEFQPRRNFLQRLSRHHVLRSRQIHCLHPVARRRYRQRTKLVNGKRRTPTILPNPRRRPSTATARRGQRHRQNLRPQSPPPARLARPPIHKPRQRLLQSVAFTRLIKPPRLGQQSLERLGQTFSRLTRLPPRPDRRLAGSMKKRILKGLRQFPKGHLPLRTTMPRQGVDFLLENPQHRRLPRPPRFDRPLGQRKRAIRHQQIRIRFWLGPQSLTSRTGPQMTIEGKMTRCQLRQPESRRRIRKRCRKPLLAPLGLPTAQPVINQRPNFVRAPPQRRAHRINQTIRSIRSNGQSINNDLHRRRMLRRKLPTDRPRRLFSHQRLHFLHHPIDPQPDKSRFL